MVNTKTEEVRDITDLAMGYIEFKPDEPKKAADLGLILEIIQKVLASIAEYCPKRLSTKNASDPSFLQKWTLRRYIKSASPNNEFYRVHGDRIEKALLKAGKDVTEDQIKKLFETKGK